MKIKSSVKSGRIAANHNPTRMKIKSGVKSGRLATNHNATRRTK